MNVANMIRKQLVDAEAAMNVEYQEAKSMLERRYIDGVAAEAAQARINRRLGADEASALRAMQEHFESVIQRERADAARARAEAEPNRMMGEELAMQNKRVVIMTELLEKVHSSTAPREVVEAQRGVEPCERGGLERRGVEPCGCGGLERRGIEPCGCGSVECGSR